MSSLKMTTATPFGVLVAFLLLLAPSGFAQIALVDNELTPASPLSDTNTALLLTTNLTVSASANTLVAVVTYRNADTTNNEAPSTLNWTNATTTNTLTLAVQIVSKNSHGRGSAIYYLYNPTAGTGFNISGKLSGQTGSGSSSSASSGAMVAYSLSGVDTTIVPPPTNSDSATGAGASSLSFTINSVTANSWAAVGGVVANNTNIIITVTNNGAATGIPVLTTTTTGFDSASFSSMGYISAIIFGGAETFTQTNAVQDCALAAVVFKPSNTNFLTFGQQPQTVTISPGQNATFTVSAAGNPAVTSYQWYEIGGGATNVIAGANTSSYTTNSPTVSAGYFVVVGNGSTSITSSVASLNISTGGIVSTWTNKLGGSWATGANWNGGTIASGSGNTADFSTLTLGASRVVTLDGARSIGNMIFGDQGNIYNWTVGTGSGGPLTLAVSSGSPTITVNNQTTAASAVMAGSAGMTKAGAGSLSLASEDTYSGLTVVSNGVLQLSANPGDDGNGTLGNSAITVYGPGELQFNAGDASGYNVSLPLTLIGGAMRQVSAYSETLGRPITLNNGTITANPGAGAFNHSPHLNGDCYNENGDVIATAANSTNYISMPAGTQFSLRGGSFSNAAGSVLIVNGVLDDFATGPLARSRWSKAGQGA